MFIEPRIAGIIGRWLGGRSYKRYKRARCSSTFSQAHRQTYSPVMKFFSILSLITLPAIVYASPTAEGVATLSEYDASSADPTITFCDGANFSGCTTYTAPKEICLAVPDYYTTRIRSSRASSGTVCFMYTTDNCSSCETCADSEGWSNMNFAPVYTIRCVDSDAQGCSNANCRHH
ncbi:hypothetical protein AMATHDRAFT_63193 [Amanita thiersii Skay4041]|uniref:Uncharacterized protein n=1 Tax=Amanita thiersii Skay4041 TaxID=703135 RepID=A0A2A9NHA5_9AGAR|nr:hypothetical protein AMATHDRAFT_63193 [Amanita thiersii Skay4041]